MPCDVTGMPGEAWELESIDPTPSSITVRFRRAPVTANLVFVTSVTAPRTGLAALDTFCGARATAAGLTGTFVAFVSTSGVDAVTRLGSARGWVRMDGLPLLDTTADIALGTRPRAPVFDELGVVAPFQFGATGSSSAGLKTANTCSDWTGTSGQADGGRPDWGWFYTFGFSNSSCANPLPVYCFQTDHVTPVTLVPPPAPAGRYIFVTDSSWPVSGGIASADAKCQSEAAGASLPGTYRALLATSTQSAADHVGGVGGTWRRPDGVVVSFSGLDAVPLDAHVGVTVTGALPSSGTNTAWFGATSLTALGTATCSDWTDASSTSVFDILVPSLMPFAAASPPSCSSAGMLVCSQMPETP